MGYSKIKLYLERLIKWDLSCLTANPYIVLMGIGLIYIMFLYPSPEYNSYNKDDASFFMTLGINLAEEGRYTVDTFPKENYGRHATWPPAFPLLLASVISLFGISWVAIKIIMVTCGLTNLYLLYRLFPDKSIGLFVITLTGISPAYFLFSHVTMTEIPFMLAVTMSLLAMERTRSASAAFGAGLFVVLAFFTRGYAVTLLPAGILFVILKNQWTLKNRVYIAFSFGVPILIAIIGWTIYTSHIIATGNIDSITSSFGNGTGLLSKLQMPLEHFAKDFYWYNSRFPVHFMLPVFSVERILSYDLFSFFGMLLLAITVWGWFFSIRNRYGAIELWLPFAIILLFIGSPSARYWVTFIPFLFYYFFIALKYFCLQYSKLNIVYFTIAIGFFCINIFSLGIHLADPDKLRFLNSYWRDYQYMAVWAKSNLPKDAEVFVHHPHNFFVASNRNSHGMGKIEIEKFQTKSCVFILVPMPLIKDKFLEKAITISEKLVKDNGPFLFIRRHGQVAIYKDNNSGYCLDKN